MGVLRCDSTALAGVPVKVSLYANTYMSARMQSNFSLQLIWKTKFIRATCMNPSSSVIRAFLELCKSKTKFLSSPCSEWEAPVLQTSRGLSFSNIAHLEENTQWIGFGCCSQNIYESQNGNFYFSYPIVLASLVFLIRSLDTSGDISYRLLNVIRKNLVYKIRKIRNEKSQPLQNEHCIMDVQFPKRNATSGSVAF